MSGGPGPQGSQTVALGSLAELCVDNFVECPCFLFTWADLDRRAVSVGEEVRGAALGCRCASVPANAVRRVLPQLSGNVWPRPASRTVHAVPDDHLAPVDELFRAPFPRSIDAITCFSRSEIVGCEASCGISLSTRILMRCQARCQAPLGKVLRVLFRFKDSPDCESGPAEVPPLAVAGACTSLDTASCSP